MMEPFELVDATLDAVVRGPRNQASARVHAADTILSITKKAIVKIPLHWRMDKSNADQCLKLLRSL